MKKPTKRQLEVVDFISAYTTQHGVAPGIRDICARFGWRSTNAASDVLRSLARKGVIRWSPKKCRTISLTNPPKLPSFDGVRGVSAAGYAFEFIPPTVDDFGEVLFV